MNLRFRLVFAAGGLIFPGGCVQSPAPVSMYIAVVEKIEDVAGDHYLPAKGRTPLTRLSLLSTSRGAFSVLIADLYSTPLYGAVGDSVAFTGPRVIPVDGSFWFEQLKDYTVVNRKAR